MSVLLTAVLVGSLVGVASGSWAAGWGGVVFGMLALGVALHLAMLRASPADRLLIVCVAMLGFALGLARLGTVGPGDASVARLVGSERSVVGTVVGRDTSETSQRLTLADLAIDGAPAEDRVLVTVPMFPRLMPGDRIEVACALRQPEAFGGFAYDRYLAARGIYAVCKTYAEPYVVALHADDSWRTAMLRVREAAIERIESVFGEPHAALLSGLVFGTSRFSDDWTERFSLTGTSHLVAASGYNVAIVASLLLTTLISLGFWRRHAFVLILVGLVAYAILAGAEPPVVRASVMGALVLLARQAGRRTTMLNVFLLAVVAMLAVEPRLMRDDVGFQLSVLSTAGLLVWARPLERKLTFVTPFAGLRASLAATLAATVATLPIVVTSFGQLSLVAPVANLLVLPLVPFAMGFGALGALLGPVVALPAWLFLTTMLQVIAFLADLSFAAFPVTTWGSRLALVLAVAAIVRFGRVMTRGPRLEAPTNAWKFVAVVAAVIVISVGLHRRTLASAAPLTVWFFDVGQGDAIFIDAPARDVLIDGGASNVVVEKLVAAMPPWDRSIDTLVVTHPHADHRDGLALVASRMHVDEILASGQYDETAANTMLAQAAPTRAVAMGDVIDLGDGAMLTALWPTGKFDDDPNHGSVVFLLTYGETSVLLTGDAGVEAEEAWNLDHVDVLKVGHHGSDTSTGQGLLTATTPSAAVISVGEGNDYGHPSPYVLSRLERFGVTTFRTDQDGDIRLTSDGGEPTVAAVRIW